MRLSLYLPASSSVVVAFGIAPEWISLFFGFIPSSPFAFFFPTGRVTAPQQTRRGIGAARRRYGEAELAWLRVTLGLERVANPAC